MPNIEPLAKAYELDLTGEFATALKSRRRALGITASELARRTQEIGYPITRGAITKMETNARAGKLDVAELFVLAAALDIPPILLLFPRFPDKGYTAVLPNITARAENAASWVSGQQGLPRSSEADSSDESAAPPPNDGMKLIAAVRDATDAVMDLMTAVRRLREAQQKSDADESSLARRSAELAQERFDLAASQIEEAGQRVWGLSNDGAEPADSGSEPAANRYA